MAALSSVDIAPRKNWYERKIEPRWGPKRAKVIRDLVHLLRNNGFNTTGSCAHDIMWIDMTFERDELVTELKTLLLENGFREFRITTSLEYRTDFVFHERSMRLEILQNKHGKV